jgi:hypothetical protein
MILFEKFGQHQPLNRQVERYAREGVPISLSTAADAVGSACKVLEPLLRLVEVYVMAAERLHGDDTTVPVMALGKCDTGRCWVYVRDDRPFGGPGPPAAMFYYSRDRGGAHPQAHLANYTGILQADALYSLIVTAKMNDVDPQAWLADVLARIATHPAHRLDELLPWNWKGVKHAAAA